MKAYITRLLLMASLAICITVDANAQSYTQHLQEKKRGAASVTVTQSSEITKIIDEADISAKKKEPAPSSQHTAASEHTAGSQHSTAGNAHSATGNAHSQATTRHPAATSQHPTNAADGQTADEGQQNTETGQHKMMRRSYKVNGYRVQIYAGGNSRKDKIKAQNVGNSIKKAFPTHPVYVHFYSPRWICRMGNYRTYEEASAILAQVKKMGYSQACIVSGKITVAY